MNCPVCQSDLGLPETFNKKMELHYDCPNCSSSLFLKGGSCEVLSANVVSNQVQEEEKSAEKNTKKAEPSSEKQKPKEPHSEILTSEVGLRKGSDSAPSSLNEVQPAKAEEALPENTEVPTLEEMEGEEAEPSEDEPQNKDETQSPKEVISQSSPEEKPEPFEFKEETSEKSAPVQSPSETEELPSEEKRETEPPAEEGKTESSDEENFSDVEKFGNAPSPTNKGAFYYDVTVNEIDSENLRSQVEEVLEDEALKLSPEQFHFSAQEGSLAIRKISPVQAHVIVKSLLGLSLKISWEQHLIADAEPGSEPNESQPVESEES